jgi:hypothetical protein
MNRTVVWFSLLTVPGYARGLPSGAAVSESDITSQLHVLVDVVVHATQDGSTFTVDEIWFRGCAT